MDILLSVLRDAASANFLIPLRSNAAFFALKSFAAVPPLAVALSVLGAALAHAANWGIGRFLLRLRSRGHLYIEEKLYARARSISRAMLPPLLCVSWWSMGGLWPLIAGFLRLSLRWTLAWVVLGQAAYYIAQAYVIH